MKKRRGLAALLAAAMCLSAIVPVYADEIAAEPFADVDVVTETVDETAEVTDTDIAEGSATQADTEETETVTEEVSSDLKDEEPEVSDDEETAAPETVEAVTEEVSPDVKDEEPITDEAVYDADVVASGNCGFQGQENVKWTLYSNGLLDIYGTGSMGGWNFNPWYDYRDAISSVTISSGITDLGSSSFLACSSLTSISMPDTLESMGYGAFSGCTSLQNIIIPDNITVILSDTFSGCTNLSSINLPYGITSINSGAFRGCTSLTKVKIPDSVTTIGNGAFCDCTNLNEVNLPNSITRFDRYIFKDCVNLSSIILPSSVPYISNEMFQGCLGLTSITIPDSVTTIGSGAFSGCKNLTEVEIPDSVTTIGSSAFCGTGLTSITIPNKVKSIEIYTFNSCTCLSSIEIPNSVTNINSNAFSNSGLISITIPGSVISIGDYAFTNCPNLSSVVISDGVTNIGIQAFYNCPNLISIELPDSVTTICNGAFRSCKNLTEIEIPDSVTSIAESAFEECENLSSVEISGNVTSIGRFAFNLCSKLTSIKIPSSVTTIGSASFYRCSGLISITIPDSVTSIGDHAFSDCSKLTHIHIPFGKNAADYKGKGNLPTKDSYYYVLSANEYCSDPDCPMGLYYEYESDIYDNFTESPTVSGAVDVVLSAKRMDVLDSADITAYIYQDGQQVSTTQNIRWTISDSSIATLLPQVDYRQNGTDLTSSRVTVSKIISGVVIVTATLDNGTSASCAVNMSSPDLNDYTPKTNGNLITNISSIQLKTSGSRPFHVTDVTGRFSGKNGELTITSSDPSVLYVDDQKFHKESYMYDNSGKYKNSYVIHVSGVNNGETTLTISADNGDSLVIPVKIEGYPNRSIILKAETNNGQEIVGDNIGGFPKKLSLAIDVKMINPELILSSVRNMVTDTEATKANIERINIQVSDGLSLYPNKDTKNLNYLITTDKILNNYENVSFTYDIYTKDSFTTDKYNSHETVTVTVYTDIGSFTCEDTIPFVNNSYPKPKLHPSDDYSNENILTNNELKDLMVYHEDEYFGGLYKAITSLDETSFGSGATYDRGHMLDGQTFEAHFCKQSDYQKVMRTVALWQILLETNIAHEAHFTDEYALEIKGLDLYSYDGKKKKTTGSICFSLNDYLGGDFMEIFRWFCGSDDDKLEDMLIKDLHFKSVYCYIKFDNKSVSQSAPINITAEHDTKAFADNIQKYVNSKFKSEIESFLFKSLGSDNAKKISQMSGSELMEVVVQMVSAYNEYTEKKEDFTNYIVSLKNVSLINSHMVKAEYQCPVDVDVYDSHNNLVASVVDNEINTQLIPVMIYNDHKVFLLYGDEEYRFVAKGNDTGKMNVYYDRFENGKYKETAAYYNLPLARGTTYTTNMELAPDTAPVYEITSNEKVIKPSKVSQTYSMDDVPPIDDPAPAKPTTVIKTAFGGRTVQLNCADADAEIYYQFGSSNITTACAHVKAGETIFLDEPMTGNRAAMYFKAYKNGKWSVLGKWGVLNVQIAQPLLKLRGNKYKGNFFIYTQTKNSYIVYTLDGTIPSIEEGTQSLKVKNGRLIWGTQGNITIPYGRTVKAIAIRCGLVTSDVMTYTNK